MKVDSKLLALKLLVKLGAFTKQLEESTTISAAGRRHLIRIRTVKAIQNGKTND